MNKRIRELVVKSDNGVMRDGKLYPHIGSRTEEDWEKFAELIVRECMTICKEHPSRILSNNWNADAVAPDIVHRFEEHFGVEE